MGPGCFHPRNLGLVVKLVFSAGLQWGRDVSIPEIDLQSRNLCKFMVLQWGRDVSIPKMFLRVLGEQDHCKASMGPGCFHPRNEVLA